MGKKDVRLDLYIIKFVSIIRFAFKSLYILDNLLSSFFLSLLMLIIERHFILPLLPCSEKELVDIFVWYDLPLRRSNLRSFHIDFLKELPLCLLVVLDEPSDVVLFHFLLELRPELIDRYPLRALIKYFLPDLCLNRAYHVVQSSCLCLVEDMVGRWPETHRALDAAKPGITKFIEDEGELEELKAFICCPISLVERRENHELDLRGYLLPKTLFVEVYALKLKSAPKSVIVHEYLQQLRLCLLHQALLIKSCLPLSIEVLNRTNSNEERLNPECHRYLIANSHPQRLLAFD